MVKRNRKNESVNDLSADVFNWFNNHCSEILNDGESEVEDLEWDLKYAPVSEWVDDIMLDLEANFGYDSEALEEYREQIEYDLNKLIDDTLHRIKYGDINGLKFARTNSDWVDKYADPEEYTKSLESKRRRNNLTLEQRISKLEKLLLRH